MKSDGKVVIDIEARTKSFEAQIEDVEEQLKQIDYEISHAKGLKLSQRDISDYKKKAEQLTNKLVDLKKRQAELDNKNIFGGIKNSIDGVLKKVAKWGLAVFGIRSAYLAVRRAMSTLTQYDTQLKEDIDYITYALATSMKPVIEAIVNTAYKVLQAINSIVYAVTGVNLFAKATADSFKSANGSAKELKKTLSGFDEMNVVSDSSSASGGTSGTATPKMDLSIISETSMKTAEEIKGFIDNIMEYWEQDFSNPFMQSMQGVYLFIKSIVEMIQGLVKVFIGIFTGDINTMIDGVKEISNGLLNFVIGILQFLLGTLETILNGMWTSIKWVFEAFIIPFLKAYFNNIGTMIRNTLAPVRAVLETIYQLIAGTLSIIFSTITNVFSKAFGFIGNIVKGIVSLFKGEMVDAVIYFFRAFANVFGALWDIAKAPINLIINGINALIKGLNKIKFDVPDWVPAIGGKTLGFNIPTIPKLAKGGILNNPGKGVYTGAIAGEAGKEFYMPLQDAEMLEMVGEAIGKYITINANITNTMNGRTISRELQRINNSSDFAYNR